MFSTIKKMRRDEKGATAIEYGLIAALIAVGLITTLGDLGTTLDEFFGGVETQLSENTPTN